LCTVAVARSRTSVYIPPSTITATDADAAATRHFSAITTPHGRRYIKSLYFPPSQPFAPAAEHRPPGNGLSLHAYIIIICAFTIFYNIYNCPRVLGVYTKNSSSSGECKSVHTKIIYMICNTARNMRYMCVLCAFYSAQEHIIKKFW